MEITSTHESTTERIFRARAPKTSDARALLLFRTLIVGENVFGVYLTGKCPARSCKCCFIAAAVPFGKVQRNNA